jgi:hypothetical protein
MFQHLLPLLNANRNLWVIVGQHRHVVNFEIDCGLAGWRNWRNLPTRVTRRSLVAGIVGQTLQRFSKTGPDVARFICPTGTGLSTLYAEKSARLG